MTRRDFDKLTKVDNGEPMGIDVHFMYRDRRLLSYHGFRCDDLARRLELSEQYQEPIFLFMTKGLVQDRLWYARRCGGTRVFETYGRLP